MGLSFNCKFVTMSYSRLIPFMFHGVTLGLTNDNDTFSFVIRYIVTFFILFQTCIPSLDILLCSAQLS